MKRVLHKIKPQFWRSLKNDMDLDPDQFTLGRYYPIVGVLRDTYYVYVIDDCGDKVTLDGRRLGLKPASPKTASKTTVLDALKIFAKDIFGLHYDS